MTGFETAGNGAAALPAGAAYGMPTWTDADEAYLAAGNLSWALAGGWRPPPVASSIALYEGEAVFLQTDFALSAFTARNVQYRTGWVVSGVP